LIHRCLKKSFTAAPEGRGNARDYRYAALNAVSHIFSSCRLLFTSRHRPFELARSISRSAKLCNPSRMSLETRISHLGEDAERTRKAEMRKQIKSLLKQTSQEEMASQSPPTVLCISSGLLVHCCSMTQLSPAFAPASCAPGEAIANLVLAAPFFRECQTAAVYLTAPRLREVDTKKIVGALTQEGTIQCQSRANQYHDNGGCAQLPDCAL